MHFVLAQRHGNAQDLPFPVRIDAHGHQNRQVTHLPILSDLFVVGI